MEILFQRCLSQLMPSNQVLRGRSRSRSQDRIPTHDRRTVGERESRGADRHTHGSIRHSAILDTERDTPRRSRSPRRSRRYSRSRSRSPRHKPSRSRSRGPERSAHSRERHERHKGRDKHRHKRSRSRSSSPSGSSDSDSERRRRKKRDKHRSREEKRERRREKKDKKVSSLKGYHHNQTCFSQKKKHGAASGAQWGKYGIINESEYARFLR